MTRKKYIIQQKEKGCKIFGVFPAQYPKEILWAMNVLPVEIWDPPLEVSHANSHLQPYICSVVRLGLELILQGQADEVDGFLFPHTCDSIQNLASIVYDYLGIDKPCYFFYHPKAPYRESSRIYYLEQLKGLISRLEKQLGPMDLTKLRQSIELGLQVSEGLRELYRLRARGEIHSGNFEFYRTIRRGEYLHPEDFIPLLNQFLERSKGVGGAGPAVILSGVLPNPNEILTLLDDLGVRVVDDDLLGCSRRIPGPFNRVDDPFEILKDSYFAMPPCTTKDSPLEDRFNYLLDKVEKSNAKGVIFNIVKFCEPELFDLPQLVDALNRKGVKTLLIDTELNQGVSGQLATKIETFVEMIS